MKGTILVPLDGSEAAERAVGLAVAVAARADAKLRLIHVHVPVDHLFGGTPVDAYRYEFQSMDDAEAYLSSLLDRLQSSAPGVITADIMRGKIVETLVHEIRKRDVGLVVMTTHGTGGLRGALMGSVATQLVREANTPMLVAGPAFTAGTTRGAADTILDVEVANILVALDGTEASSRILPHATRLGRLFGARLTLISVVPEAILGSSLPGAAAASTLGPAPREIELGLFLDRTAEQLIQSGLPANRRLVRADDVAGAILRSAAEEDADIIAMTTHARSPVMRAVLGSVAAAVVAAARTPVLLYRPVA
jgi:nucleotide-binding universal stress UspA family protein